MKHCLHETINYQGLQLNLAIKLLLSFCKKTNIVSVGYNNELVYLQVVQEREVSTDHKRPLETRVIAKWEPADLQLRACNQLVIYF